MNTLFLAALAAIADPASVADLPPVGCIVSHTDRLPQGQLMEAVKAGFAPTTASGKATMELIGRVVQQCERTYGWSKTRKDAAVMYFASYTMRTEAIEQGRRFGMSAATIDGYIATLKPEARAAYAAGKPTPELNRAAFEYLPTAGVKLDGLAQSDVQALGQAFNMGVYASIGRADADKRYSGK